MNFEDSSYWASTWRAPLPGTWLFHFGIGKQDYTGPFEEFLIAYAWPVRDGDVAAADADLDGIPDGQDNCINVANGPTITDAGGKIVSSIPMATAMATSVTETSTATT